MPNRVPLFAVNRQAQSARVGTLYSVALYRAFYSPAQIPILSLCLSLSLSLSKALFSPCFIITTYFLDTIVTRNKMRSYLGKKAKGAES